MIRMRKSLFISDIIIVGIICLVIGWYIGCTINSNSAEVIATSCEHENLENSYLVEQSCIYLDVAKKYPTQKMFYNTLTDNAYVYTYYWIPREKYNNQYYLQTIEILKINKDGSVELIK